MNRPDDIPTDVWEAAEAAFRDETLRAHMSGDHVGPLLCISRAILAERERCAAKADRYTTAKGVRRARARFLTADQVYEVKIFARLIAYDIRTPASPTAPKPVNDDDEFAKVPHEGIVR